MIQILKSQREKKIKKDIKNLIESEILEKIELEERKKQEEKIYEKKILNQKLDTTEKNLKPTTPKKDEETDGNASFFHQSEVLFELEKKEDSGESNSKKEYDAEMVNSEEEMLVLKRKKEAWIQEEVISIKTELESTIPILESGLKILKKMQKV